VADLHALVSGFADVAAAYERGRPEYGPAVTGAIVDALGAAPGARVLDVGAGTGKLARPLLRAGFDVVAVEPLAGMRAALARAIGPQRVREGRAEALPLEDASVDGAVCGDAFHWFDGDRAAAELFRTVRAGGGIVACWLTSSPDDGARPPFAVEVDAVLEPLWRAARHPYLVQARGAEGLERHGGFAPLQRRSVRFQHITDRDGLLAYYASISYVGALEPPERSELLQRLAAILDRHGVREVRRPYRAELTSTRRLADDQRPGRSAAADAAP
jgi:ubiquinone/menaquinone biosynthesis C-methylase UbiE